MITLVSSPKKHLPKDMQHSVPFIGNYGPQNIQNHQIEKALNQKRLAFLLYEIFAHSICFFN